jgi:hypothetical protein
MALPVISLSLLPSTVNEDSGGAFVYTFKRTGDLSASLIVNYQLGGTSTSDSITIQSFFLILIKFLNILK